MKARRRIKKAHRPRNSLWVAWRREKALKRLRGLLAEQYYGDGDCTCMACMPITDEDICPWPE